jgi:hypothetical protein
MFNLTSCEFALAPIMAATVKSFARAQMRRPRAEAKKKDRKPLKPETPKNPSPQILYLSEPLERKHSDENGELLYPALTVSQKKYEF